MLKKSSFITTVCISLPFVLLLGCNKAKDEPTQTEASAHIETTTTPDATPVEPQPMLFNIENIAISQAVLGDFPYISLPDGYRYQNDESRNFERVPFWTGQDFEWVEGKLFSSGITEKSDYKEGGFLEIQRNTEAVIKQLGGVEVTNSQIPAEKTKEIPDEIRIQHSSGLGDIYNYPAQTYVIRQADKNIWFHLAKSGTFMSIMVAETKPLRITAKALSSSELKSTLDKDNKVNLQINFATDKADILPDSQPQLDQVIALLKEHKDLKLAINGHTDNTGDAKHNKALSEQRAQSVVKALTANTGIDASRLTAQGFGDTQAIADNTTEQGKALNRRVELVKQ